MPTATLKLTSYSQWLIAKKKAQQESDTAQHKVYDVSSWGNPKILQKGRQIFGVTTEILPTEVAWQNML